MQVALARLVHQIILLHHHLHHSYGRIDQDKILRRRRVGRIDEIGWCGLKNYINFVWKYFQCFANFRISPFRLSPHLLLQHGHVELLHFHLVLHW